MDAELAPPETPLVADVPVAAGGFLGRAVWSFAGQAVSSGSNFLLSALVLAVAEPAEFAVFSVCVLTYGAVVQLTRAAVAVAATLLQTGDEAVDHAQQRAAVGVTVAVSAVAAAILLAASLLAGAGRSMLELLGVLLPLLLYQDALRYVCYARGRPPVAAASDLAWLALQTVTSVALIATGRDSATALVAAWAVAGTVSGLGAGLYLRLAPGFGTAATWVRDHRALWKRLLGEFVVASSSHYAVYYGLAIVAGAGALGRVKAAQTLLGPVVVLVLGGGALGVPESVRVAGDPARLRHVARRISGFLVGASAVCGLAAYLLVPEFGPRLFPHAWEGARPLVPALTVLAVAAGASTGPSSALRALGQNGWLLRVRTATGLIVVVTGVAASALFGAQGALVVIAGSECVVAAVLWRRFGIANRVPATR